jgi:hypothetical protein
MTMVEMVCSEAVSEAALAGTRPQCSGVLNLTQNLVFQYAWVFVAIIST